jgi:signal transduction histidine kinase
VGLAFRAEQAASTSSDAQGFVDIFEKLIDALPEQIALVDEHWGILAVNAAWTKTAALYGYEALRPGTNYATFCRAKVNEGHEAARPAIEGIAEIDAGRRSSFYYLYDGSGRWEGFTFKLVVNRLSIASRTFATITRYDVTELLQLRRQRESFGASLIETQGQERRRIARELHDSTQQMLVSVALGLGQLKRMNGSGLAVPIVEELQQLLSEAQREIRSIAYMAHPPVLENLGLHRALEELVIGYGRRTGLATTFHAEGVALPAWAAAETAIYRVVQEAISNVHRHAHATRMDVGLFRRRSMTHVTIKDDGLGLPSMISPGVGLPGMKARLSELGGRLWLRSCANGTTIVASVPGQPRIRSVGDLAW